MLSTPPGCEVRGRDGHQLGRKGTEVAGDERGNESLRQARCEGAKGRERDGQSKSKGHAGGEREGAHCKIGACGTRKPSIPSCQS